MAISPRKLKVGNKVAIVAPSSPFKSDELQEGLDTIASLGLIPVLGQNVKNLHVRSIHAASTQARAEELMWAFSSPDISAVISAVGGFGCAEILPFLDYKKIAASKRIFIAKSDGTALNNAIYSKADLINFSAQTPCLHLDKGERAYEASIRSLVHVLRMCMDDATWEDRSFAINDLMPRTINGGKASGVAVGGNLDTFSRLIGTKFLPETKKCILFIEDVHKGSTSIARMLLHLKLSGILEKVSGVVVGEFSEVPAKKDERDPSIEDVLLEYLGDDMPVVYGYSFSHGLHVCPIPIGAMTYLDADARSINFRFRMSS